MIVGWGFHKERENILDFMISKWLWRLKLLLSYRNNFGYQIMKNFYYFLSVKNVWIKWWIFVDLLIIIIGWGFHKEIENILDFYDFQMILVVKIIAFI